MEKLVEWYIKDRLKWIDGIPNMREYFSIQMYVTPEVTKGNIRSTMMHNIAQGLYKKEINESQLFDFNNAKKVDEFIEAVFEGLKKEIPSFFPKGKE